MSSTNIKYSYSFLNKFSIQAKIPDSNDVILCSRDTQELILMKQIEVLPQEYEETLATLQYEKRLSHEQLLSLVDYHAQPSLNKFLVLYQYCSITLQDQFKNRLAQHRMFQQSELWSIFTSLAFGLAYLQQQNVGHGSVSLSDCYLNQQGFVKISDPTCATSNPYTVVKGYFYAPQILRCLVNQTGQQVNIFKSDIFCLGCCMLQLTLMKDISQIFNYEKGQIHVLLLEQYKQQLNSLNLSRQYTDFIHQALALNTSNRLDFVQLRQLIFHLLSIDPAKSSQPMKKALSIKSSLSSLYRSKGQPNINIKQVFKSQIITQEIVEEGREVLSFGNLTNTQFQEKINNNLNNNHALNLDQNILNLDFFKIQPNVDHVFGNLKKSIHLQDENERMLSQNDHVSPSIIKSKQDTKASEIFQKSSFLSKNHQLSQLNEKGKKRLRETDLMDRYKRDAFSYEQRKTPNSNFQHVYNNTEQKSFSLREITNINKIANSQIFLDTPRTLYNFEHNNLKNYDNKLSSKANDRLRSNSYLGLNSNAYNNESANLYQNLIFKQNKQEKIESKSQYQYVFLQLPGRYSYMDSKQVGKFRKQKQKIAQSQSYTNPDFLKMMKADVQQILSRRKSFQQALRHQ